MTLSNLISLDAGFFLAAIYFLSLSYSPFLKTGKDVALKVSRCAFVIAFILFIACFWFKAIRDYQHKPRFVTSTLNGKVISSVWVTNPAYITFRSRYIPTSNGFEILNTPVTNFYWSVWKWLK